MRILAVMVLSVMLAVPSCMAHGMEETLGWTCDAGIAFSDEVTTPLVSMSGTFLAINGSIDYFANGIEDEDDSSSMRGYLGIGMGPVLQLQVGYGTDDIVSGRLKSTWSIQQLLHSRGGGRTGFGTTGSDSWLGFDSPDGWLTRGFTLSGICECLEGGGWLGGIQLGLLIW